MFVFKKKKSIYTDIKLAYHLNCKQKILEKSNWKASITIKGIQSLKQHFLHS